MDDDVEVDVVGKLVLVVVAGNDEVVIDGDDVDVDVDDVAVDGEVVEVVGVDTARVVVSDGAEREPIVTPLLDVRVRVMYVVVGADGAGVGAACATWSTVVVAPWPTYGDGHCVAIAAHCSGVSPEQTEAACTRPLVGADPMAEGARQAVFARTGRLAIVISTGPAASPPRNSRRRSSEASEDASGDAGRSTDSLRALIPTFR